MTRPKRYLCVSTQHSRPKGQDVMCVLKMISLLWLASIGLQAQILPTNPTVQRSATNVQMGIVMPGATPTTLSFSIDSQPQGIDQLEIVTTDPAVAISLVQPNGTTVSADTASSYGIGWTSTVVSDQDGNDHSDPFSLPGTHISIQLPNTAPGMYQVVASGTQLSTKAGLLVQYFSSGSVLLGVAADSASYRSGDPVTIAAVISDGATPIQGASISAEIYYSYPVSATISGFALVNQQDQGDGSTAYTYAAQLTGLAANANGVMASATTGDTTVTILQGDLHFGDVLPGQAAPSLNTITVIVPNNVQFDAASLTWTITAASSATTLALPDSGSADRAPGDGAHDGTGDLVENRSDHPVFRAYSAGHPADCRGLGNSRR